METQDKGLLAQDNKHERDERIVFIDEGHRYIVDGTADKYISVTTFVHQFFNDFDATHVLRKMKGSTRWTSSPYYGQTDAEIREQWDRNTKEALALGTLLHKSIEDFYNDTDGTEPKKTCSDIETEWSYFERFHKSFQKKPYRTEWYVFDESLRIAGSIDMVFQSREDDTTHVILVDWKRIKELRQSNKYQRGIYPLHEMDDCNYVHYSLQLNIYRHLLQTKYGKIVDHMYLVILHKNHEDYIQVEVPVLEKQVQDMLQTLSRS